MQDDDTANPGMLWVLDGEALWNARPALPAGLRRLPRRRQASMKGVAARYPAFDARANRPVNLEQRINICRASSRRRRPSPTRAGSCSR